MPWVLIKGSFILPFFLNVLRNCFKHFQVTTGMFHLQIDLQIYVPTSPVTPVTNTVFPLKKLTMLESMVPALKVRFFSVVNLIQSPLLFSTQLFSIWCRLLSLYHLRIPYGYNAKITKICNLWTFRNVIQLINHLFTI